MRAPLGGIVALACWLGASPGLVLASSDEPPATATDQPTVAMSTAAADAAADAAAGRVVAAYLPEYRFGIDLERVCAHATDVILFSIEVRAHSASAFLITHVLPDS